MKNVLVLCRTNHIRIDTPRDVADCIISIGSIFQWCCFQCLWFNSAWSVNMGLINEVNEILKYQCNINGFTFIFQDHGWTFANGSLDCSLFYKDLLHLIEQGNIKLTKSIKLIITLRYKDINLSSTDSNMPYSDITRQKAESTIYFSLNEHDFPPLSNVSQSLKRNLVNHVCINVNLLVM